MEFSVWNRIKRRIRRKRGTLTLAMEPQGIQNKQLTVSKRKGYLASVRLYTLVLLVVALLISSEQVLASSQNVGAKDEKSQMLEQLLAVEGRLTVMHHRIYVCGEEMQKIGYHTGQQIVQMLVDHPGWTVDLSRDQKTVFLVERIEDLSDYCKGNAFFGLDKQRYLSIFDGQPQFEKVMRTFFQLNVEYMESRLPSGEMERLVRGIPVRSMEEYNSVLSTYSEFSIGRSQTIF